MDEAWRERVRERAYAIWQREGSPDGAAEQFWLMAEEELLAEGQSATDAPPAEPGGGAVEEAKVDQAGDDSFPASDPPAWTSDTGAGAPKKARKPKRG